MRMRKTWAASLLGILGLCASLLLAGERKPAASMDESRRALHALNRLTFGPRPGEVEKVRAMGVDKWIERQLRPEKIDDRRLQARLAPFQTLHMDAREMLENYPSPQVLRAVAEGRMPMPSDPKKRAVYEAALENYKMRQARQQREAQNGERDSGEGAAMDTEISQERREARMYAELEAERLRQLPAEERLAAVLKMEPEERQALLRSLSREEREQFVAGLSPEQRAGVMARMNPTAVVVTELQQAKLLRAAYSERQLEEVMTDFWFNHFNVFLNKGPDRYLVTSYERDVIRPHALGKFRDMLVATAESPAMLFYLDNWTSVGPNSEQAKNGGRARGAGGRQRQMGRNPGSILLGGMGRNRQGQQRTGGGNDEAMRQQQQQAQQMRRGLNENYARELMELHTLGVDGGYTQRDVTEVARAFTGWTIRRPQLGGDFHFEERMHEPGPKQVLDQTISGGGKKEGMKVLDLLARHPSTAKFISTKLAQRFVADEPPPALVERMAQTFQKTDGDIREVLRTLFRSEEFWSPEAYRAKVKTPLEFVASAVRATGAEVSSAMPLVQSLNRLGMPLYQAQPPTGYSMRGEAWVNSAALLNRMNIALALSLGRIGGVDVQAQQLLGNGGAAASPDGALAALENALLAGDVSPATHQTIRKQLANPQEVEQMVGGSLAAQTPGLIAGLLLGSPEFQRR